MSSSVPRLCPWCGDPYTDPDAVCDGCMRAPAQHPSYKKASGPLLELDAAVSAPPPPRARSLQPAPAPPAQSASVALDDDDEAPAGPHGGPSDLGALAEWDDPGATPDIALDLGSMPPPAMKPAVSAAPPVGRSLSSQVGPSLGPGRQSDPSLPPSGPISGRPSADAIDEPPPPPSRDPVADALAREVHQLAGYGPDPKSLVETPIYALRVYQRRNQLRVRLRSEERRHTSAKQALHRKLAAEADAIAAREPQLMKPLMAPVVHAGARAAQLGAMQAQAAQAEETARTAAQSATAREGRARRTIAQLRDKLEQAHADATRASGGSDYATPEDARRIAAIELELKDAERELAEAERAKSDARRSLDGASRQAHPAVAVAGTGAGDTALEAYAAVMQRVEREMPHLIEPEQRIALAAVRTELAALDTALEKHRRAIDAFHVTSYRQGLGIAVAFVAVLLLVVLSFARVG